MRIVKLTKETTGRLLEELLERSPNSYGDYESRVNEIIEQVRTRRDEAVFAYTKQFDGADLNAGSILVTEKEIQEAYDQIDPTLLDVMRKSLVNIRSFHEKQRQQSWFTTEASGILLGQKVTPLKTVGVYVPGGKAVYPSSVLMNVLPAKAAGVERIIMTTPPDQAGKICASTLVAAKEAGVDEIYKAGGAQAVAAMAFGTQSIPKVDKIVGPGNIYVALAKKAYTECPTIINGIKPDGNSEYDKSMLSYSKMDAKISSAQYDIGLASNIAQLAISYWFDRCWVVRRGDKTNTNKKGTSSILKRL